jgi:hypothetical protein
LCDEHGNEIDRVTTPSDEAIRCAIMLLARSKALRPGYRLTVSTGGRRQRAEIGLAASVGCGRSRAPRLGDGAACFEARNSRRNLREYPDLPKEAVGGRGSARVPQRPTRANPQRGKIACVPAIAFGAGEAARRGGLPRSKGRVGWACGGDGTKPTRARQPESRFLETSSSCDLAANSTGIL